MCGANRCEKMASAALTAAKNGKCGANRCEKWQVRRK